MVCAGPSHRPCGSRPARALREPGRLCGAGAGSPERALRGHGAPRAVLPASALAHLLRRPGRRGDAAEQPRPRQPARAAARLRAGLRPHGDPLAAREARRDPTRHTAESFRRSSDLIPPTAPLVPELEREACARAPLPALCGRGLHEGTCRLRRARARRPARGLRRPRARRPRALARAAARGLRARRVAGRGG